MDKARVGGRQCAAAVDSLGPVDVEPEPEFFGKSASSDLAGIAGGDEGGIAGDPVCHGAFPFYRWVAEPALKEGQVLFDLCRDDKCGLRMPA